MQNKTQSKGMQIYEYPQEVWDEAKCAKMAKYAPKDHWGNRPPKGIISPDGSAYLTYGKTLMYNGGCVHNCVWYEGEHVPLPSIHKNYEFHYLSTWGITIRRKERSIPGSDGE